LQIVVICKGETSKSVIIEVISIEDRYIVSSLLQILTSDNQKVLNVLRDWQANRVDSDSLDFLWREIYVEFLKAGIVDVEDHFSESRVLFSTKHDVVVIVDRIFPYDSSSGNSDILRQSHDLCEFIRFMN